MHDIKFIKNNSSLFDEILKKRNIFFSSKEILLLYQKYLENLKKTQNLQEKKNLLSKKFSPKLSQKDLEKIKNDVAKIKSELDELKKITAEKEKKINQVLLEIPNLVDERVPVGKSENDNVIIKESGKIDKPSFDVKNHVEVLEKHNLLDYNKASKLSGSRFSVLRSSLATLHRALVNFMIDINVMEFQYEECIVPELVKSDCLIGTGQLPKFNKDLFKTDFNDLWLIPTAEVPLTNFHREEIIDSTSLPLRYTSFTNCFRSEAGAAGKDTRGLMREHQFGKVELVSITEPFNSMSEMERMIECVELILKKLSIPYRLVELCSGDLGFSSSYTVDFEVWMPGQKKFREVSSCSNCKEFQARRMKMRAKNPNTGEIYYPHTLNGSSIAVGRILISIIENYQQEDGSILIPNILRNYMKGITSIGNK
ncbi:MAG: serine--tRNA ligase [Rickettsiales bacterium]|nr:serine--tRNA ligase [Rickettsiales bacterium]RPG13552.1 MAG: serine--tRNA ligase [Pelagibacteraceae bacterium TMED195]|tara:strand:+ start:40 stop:1314 length:1275 start_codon:yes stop_codon:yes gene_type:complete